MSQGGGGGGGGGGIIYNAPPENGTIITVAGIFPQASGLLGFISSVSGSINNILKTKVVILPIWTYLMLSSILIGLYLRLFGEKRYYNI